MKSWIFKIYQLYLVHPAIKEIYVSQLFLAQTGSNGAKTCWLAFGAEQRCQHWTVEVLRQGVPDSYHRPDGEAWLHTSCNQVMVFLGNFHPLPFVVIDLDVHTRSQKHGCYVPISRAHTLKVQIAKDTTQTTTRHEPTNSDHLQQQSSDHPKVPCLMPCWIFASRPRPKRWLCWNIATLWCLRYGWAHPPIIFPSLGTQKQKQSFLKYLLIYWWVLVTFFFTSLDLSMAEHVDEATGSAGAPKAAKEHWHTWTRRLQGDKNSKTLGLGSHDLWLVAGKIW